MTKVNSKIFNPEVDAFTEVEKPLQDFKPK